MLEGPIFTAPINPGISGDDPLGTAPVNERLYNAIFPGINNFVRYVRIYSAMCWAVYQVEEYLETKGGLLTTSEAARLARHACEKVQLVLIWLNKPKNYMNLAGSQRVFPQDNEMVDLVFDQFANSTVGLLDAGTYGPSITTGLGFLERRSGGTYGCTEPGRRLALAFDVHAKSFSNYEWLADVANLTTNRNEVFELDPLFDLGGATNAEQQAFLAQFFPAGNMPEGQFDQHRWLAIHLMLRALDAASKSAIGKVQGGYVDEQAVRIAMATARAPDGVPFSIHGVEAIQAWWTVLQLRQLHRLAIDTLFTVTETWLADERDPDDNNSVGEIAELIGRSCVPGLEMPFRATVSMLKNHLLKMQGAELTLYAAASLHQGLEQADAFKHIDDLLTCSYAFSEGGGNDAVTLAYKSLVFCALEATNLLAQPLCEKTLREADSDMCSLIALTHLAQKYSEQSPVAFMSDIVKNWVILRHFQIASSRAQATGDGKNRFRFVIGDRGLERYAPTVGINSPSFGQDKLEHMLFLCWQSGLLEERQVDKAHWYRLSSAGRERLKELAV
jgi:hypothetical protein